MLKKNWEPHNPWDLRGIFEHSFHTSFTGFIFLRKFDQQEYEGYETSAIFM